MQKNIKENMQKIINVLTLVPFCDKIVSIATVAYATYKKGGIKMPTLMRRINVISRCSVMYKSERLAGELSGCHHPFVMCITRNPGLSQDEIARRICLNKSTVARALSYLEEHGFVKREADKEDKRVLRVFPTDKMKDAYPAIKALSAEWNALISDGISEEDMAVFVAVLEKIEARAKEIGMGGDRV